MVKLEASSPLGHPRAQMGKSLFDTARLQIREAPFTRVFSVRQSRKAQDNAALTACLQSLGAVAPIKPNGLSGTAQHGCAWLEPNAWLVLAEKELAKPAAPASLLVTDISDRICQFKLSGEGAQDIVAAGCDPQMIPVGTMARTRFASLANVIIERHAETEYRLTLDVSLAAMFAGWLLQSAGNQ